MTCHVNNTWRINDGVDKAPIQEIAEAVKIHQYSCPPLYGVWSHSDSFILAIGTFLKKNRNTLLTKELVQEHFPDNVGDDVIEVIIKVLEHLQILNTILE